MTGVCRGWSYIRTGSSRLKYERAFATSSWTPRRSIFEQNAISSKQAFLSTPHSDSRHGRRALSSHVGENSTIYALSTAPGRAAIAIVRCSGPACLDIYRALCPCTPLPKPRHATLRTIFGPSASSLSQKVLDSGALVLYFPAPHTATGEDVLEFHVHGGPAVVRAVLAGISKSVPPSTAAHSSRPTVSYAEPGEFTRRAFYNGRLDLTQVEALGDTLAAETEQQRQLAVRGTSNTLNERYESWRDLLLQARGELEALIDFSEDQHFDDSPAAFTASVAAQVFDLRRRIQASIENAAKGELLRGGISIALLGAPNAGKSSLLNQIVGREAAIVSKEAGTTRDVVEVKVDIGGFFCRFGDLAGLRAGSVPGQIAGGAIGEIETEGIRRAKARVLSADVVVVVLALERVVEGQGEFTVRIDPEVASTLVQCDLQRQRIVFAINKVDLLQVPTGSLGNKSQLPQVKLPEPLAGCPICYISCVDANSIPTQAKQSFPTETSTTGIQPLLTGLSQAFTSLTSASSTSDDPSTSTFWDESLGASERQRLLLIQTAEHLDDFLREAGNGMDKPVQMGKEEQDVDVVLAAESLRAAAECLGRITGKGGAGDAEEVLGVVFEKFCVGK